MAPLIIPLLLFFLVASCHGLTGMTWRLDLKLGKIGILPGLPDGWTEHVSPEGKQFYHHAGRGESSWVRPERTDSEARAAMAGPPLAMFAPGGGTVALPAWYGSQWASSGEQIGLPLELEFLPDYCVPAPTDEPLRRAQCRKLFARCVDPAKLEMKTESVAWGLVELSSIEALLVWSIDLPEGVAADAAGSTGVSLAAGTRIFCSTQVWKGNELARLTPLLTRLQAELVELTASSQAALLPTSGEGGKDAIAALKTRIKKLERGLPRPGVPTLEVPGWAGDGAGVTISTRGQVAVQRFEKSKLFNPFDNAGKLFGGVEFGVVGSFLISPPAEGMSGMLSSEGGDASEVEVVVDSIELNDPP